MMDVNSSNLVTISCADHSQHVVTALRNLFYSKRGTDFDLRFGGKSVRVHRLILELFLAPELVGTVQDEPSVPLAIKQEVPDDGCGSGSSVLDLVMEFLYKGEVAAPEQQLEDLLGVAKELDFKMLIEAIHACRPIDIIPDDDLNFDMKSNINISVNANEFAGLLEPRIENIEIKREAVGNTGSILREVNRDMTLRPCFVNMGPRISISYRNERNGSGSILHQRTSQTIRKISNNKRLQLQPNFIKLEPDDVLEDCPSELENVANSMDLVSSSTGSDEDDGNETRDAPGTSTNPSKTNKNNPRAARINKCRLCQYQASNIGSYQHHCMSSHHSTAHGKPSTSHKDDGVATMDNSFNRGTLSKPSQKNTKTRRATRIYKCSHCQFRGSNLSHYRYHCVSSHQLTTIGKPASLHKCPKCDYSCYCSSTFNKHLSARHCQNRKHACPQCSYLANSKNNLKQHLITIHGVGDSNFTCQVCGKRCVSHRNLERHFTVHERPFKCHLCNYAARLKCDVKRHFRNHAIE